MSDASSLAPSASISQVNRRVRPGRRERAAARSNGSTSTANAPKATAFGSSADPVFSPGKYPVVFDVGVGDPAASAGMVLDVGGFVNHSENVLDALRSESRFTQFMADSQVLLPAAWDQFESEFHAASLCTLASGLVKAHTELQFPAGDFGPVTTSDAYHLDSIHTVASQYGEFKVPYAGRRYLWPGYAETITNIVYVADSIMRNPERQDVKDRWWLPVSRTDPNFRFVIACRIMHLFNQWGESMPGVDEVVQQLFSGQQAPDWLEVILEHHPPAEPLRRLFERTIEDREDVVDLLGADPDGHEARNLLGLPWSNPNPNDMNWQFNVKAAFGDIQARWALRRPYLEKSFALATVPSRSGSYLGQTTQLSSLANIADVTVLSVAYADEKHLLSMAACFPPTAVFPPIERLDVRVTSIKNVGEVRNVWIIRDFK